MPRREAPKTISAKIVQVTKIFRERPISPHHQTVMLWFTEPKVSFRCIPENLFSAAIGCVPPQGGSAHVDYEQTPEE